MAKRRGKKRSVTRDADKWLSLVGYGCAILWILGKTYVDRWIYTPVQRRPPFARHNEFLRTIDLFCWLALIGVFFFLLFGDLPWLAFALVAGLLLYHALVAEAFVLWEVTQLRRQHPKRRYREAHRHVRRRADTLMFH